MRSWPLGTALTLPGSPSPIVIWTSAPSGSTALPARLSSLVIVTGVPGPTWCTMMGAKSVSVSHWSVGDGASVAPIRSVSTPVCPHGPIT